VVVGATGYSGGELCALLLRHPRVELVATFGSATRRDSVAFESLHPSLRDRPGPRCEPFSQELLFRARPDLVFLATPNETSAELADKLVAANLRVIDLSGAFRLPSAADYPTWYGFDHPHAALLGSAAYSLPELLDEAGRTALLRARLIANPGCYATSVILALAPVAHLVDPREAVIADCKSGATGAGKRTELAYSFTELVGNFKTYATKGHRHEPEIRRALGWNMERAFVFVPHLLPVARGILSSIYVPLAAPADAGAIAELYRRRYAQPGLVGLRAHGSLPELNDVVGTPRCDLGFQILPGGRRLLVVAALDNLLKGAASQAVQNLNLACGFGDLDGLS